MAIDLQSLIQSELGAAAVGRLSGLLGEPEAATQGALRCAVPALVGGLVNRASTPAGASALLTILRELDPGLFADAVANFRGERFEEITREGGVLLPSIFGAKLGPVVDVLTRATSLGRGSVGRLLSALAPVVLGTVGRAVGREGLDAEGLANLLDGQREHLVAALPAGLGDVLGFPEAPVHREFSNPNLRVRRAPPRQSSAGRWLPIVLGLVLAWFGYQYFASGERTPGLPDVAAEAPDGLVAGLDQTIEELSGTLATVNDAASAREVLPTLRAAERHIEDLSLGLGVLPGSVRDELADRARAFGPRLDAMMGRIGEIPGAGEVLTPVAEKIARGFDALAGS